MEITPFALYARRHAIMASAAAVAVGSGLVACGSDEAGTARTTESVPTPAGQASSGTPATTVPTGDDALTPFETATTYNNYYEFSTDKERVAKLASTLTVSPWSLTVGGLVTTPRTYAIDDLLTKFRPDERIYRLRCVEGWSMVLPWQGFSLARILDDVAPLATAKYLRFETVNRPSEMPGLKSGGPYPWPYAEGLRLDEAKNPLATIATGLYGKPLPVQNGAPVRLVVPWKYGFKSIKSIVKIEFVAEQPKSLWMAAGPDEYGFYANVNPEVAHPRWSQATERRIGELKRRPTLFLNGYADQVGSLYTGMDLRRNF